MQAAALLLVCLVGGGAARYVPAPRLVARKAQGPGPVGANFGGLTVGDVVRDGIGRLGPTGGPRANGMFPPGGGMPFSDLVGGLPELRGRRFRPPRPDEAPPGTPGAPLGPRKKPDLNPPPWTGCNKRGLACAVAPTGLVPGDKRAAGPPAAGANPPDWAAVVSRFGPAKLRPLVEGLRRGDFTQDDCFLAFERAFSEAIRDRWTNLGSAQEAAESLYNMVLDVSSTAQYGTPVGLWLDVLHEVPRIAKQIHQADRAEAKLRVARQHLHPAVELWHATPVGVAWNSVVEAMASATALPQVVALTVYRLWSRTPLGWAVSQMLPVEALVRLGSPGDAEAPDAVEANASTGAVPAAQDPDMYIGGRIGGHVASRVGRGQSLPLLTDKVAVDEEGGTCEVASGEKFRFPPSRPGET